MPATLFTIFAAAFVTGALIHVTPLAFSLLLVLTPLLRSTITPSNRVRLRYLILILAATTAGYSYALLRAPALDQSALQALTGEQTVTIEVVESPRRFDYSQRFKAKFISADLEKFGLVPLMVNAPLGPILRLGDQLRVVGLVRVDHYRSAPTLAITTTGLERIGTDRSLSRTMALLQDSLWSALIRRLPTTAAELSAGLFYGRPLENPDLRQSFRQTGLSHLTAVSGYNLTLVASAITRILVAVAFPRLAVTGVSLAAVLLFTLFSGAQSSVVRAAFMSIILIVVRAGGRVPLTRNILLAAALGITVLHPTNLAFDLGFQLSLLAVAGLFYLAPAFFSTRPTDASQTNQDQSPLITALKQIAAETLGAQLAVMPLLWYYFGQINLFALPINLLVTPFVPFLMACAFLSLLLLPLPLLPLITALPFMLFAKIVTRLGPLTPSLTLPSSALTTVGLYLILLLAIYYLNRNHRPDFYPPTGKINRSPQ